MNDLANNDNSLTKVAYSGGEFLLSLRLWDGRECRLQTVNCTSLHVELESVSEIGEIEKKDGVYYFKEPWENLCFLEICADDLVILSE